MRPHPRRPALAFLVSALLASAARAGNGPETAPVPLPVFRSVPLKKNAYRLDFDAAYTRYDETSLADAQQSALDHGSFESFDHTLLNTVTLDYGCEDDITVGASIGYFFGSDLVRTEREEPASVAVSEADPDGLTDLWLTGSWNFDPLRGFTALGGVELPVGEHGQTGSDGTHVSPASQPSDNAFGVRFGLAWSSPTADELSVAASALYTLRTEHDGESIGDRADYGVALTWHASPRVDCIAEISGATLWKDDELAGLDDNTGGNVIFATPQVRYRIADNVALWVAPAIPLFQDLNGDQADVRLRVGAGLSVSF
jgi:outer membrane putative beta-barrel porin/alpha-amylase